MRPFYKYVGHKFEDNTWAETFELNKLKIGQFINVDSKFAKQIKSSAADMNRGSNKYFTTESLKYLMHPDTGVTDFVRCTRVGQELIMAKCTLLVGLPAAGKSTWLVKNKAMYIASSDDIITTMGREYGMSYTEAWPLLNKFAEKAFLYKVKAYAKYKLDFYIDRTNLTKKARAKIINIIKEEGEGLYWIDAMVFPLPKEYEWQRRLDVRQDKFIPKEVLDNMLNIFDFPTEDEGFKRIIVAEDCSK